MENIIDFTSGKIPEKSSDKSPEPKITEIIIDGEVVDVSPEAVSEAPEISEEYTHIRSPEISRNSQKILMTGIAVAGTAAGAVAALSGAFGENPAERLAERFSAGFWSVFSGRFLINTGCLAVEFLFAFFALGDLLVWVVPLFLGLGTGLTFASIQHAALLPSAAAVILCGGFGAAFSSCFSTELRFFAGGKNRRTDDFPAKYLAARFFVLLIGMSLAALYEGIIAEFAL